MINLSNITNALILQLENFLSVVNLQPNIERGGFINNDPDNAPWIGVYRKESVYDPMTLGSHGRSFKNVSTIIIMVQESSAGSGSDCEDRLENLVKHVLDCVVSDKTIGGTVDMVNGFSIEYMYSEADRESLFFQSAAISLTVEVTTG